MATKKAVKSPSKPVQTTRVPPQALKAEAKRPSLAELAKKALELRQKHEQPAETVAAKAPVTFVEYKITMSDGTILLATGEHADVFTRFLDECQKECTNHGLTHYGGPKLRRLTQAQYDALNR